MLFRMMATSVAGFRNDMNPYDSKISWGIFIKTILTIHDTWCVLTIFLLPFSLILTFYHLIFTYKTLLFAPFVHSFQSFSGKSEIFTFYRYFILFFLQTLDFSDHLTISSVSFVFFYLLFTYTNYRQIHLFLFVDSSIFQ